MARDAGCLRRAEISLILPSRRSTISFHNFPIHTNLSLRLLFLIFSVAKYKSMSYWSIDSYRGNPQHEPNT